MIFLDSFLGEETLADKVEYTKVSLKDEVVGNLRPIGELEEYLEARSKLLREKFSEEALPDLDSYSAMTGTSHDGEPITAVVNPGLIDWHAKAAYPWILAIKLRFRSSGETQLLYELEDRLIDLLAARDGYLNLGRTSKSKDSDLFFACKEYRQASRVVREFQNETEQIVSIDFDIFLDRGWKALAFAESKRQSLLH